MIAWCDTQKSESTVIKIRLLRSFWGKAAGEIVDLKGSHVFVGVRKVKIIPRLDEGVLYERVGS